MNRRIRSAWIALVTGFLVSSVSAEGQNQPTVADIARHWSQKYQEFLTGPNFKRITDRAQTPTSTSPPNTFVHPGSPLGEDFNSSVALSETVLGQVYVAFTDFFGLGFVPSDIGHSWSPAGGAPGTWVYLGAIPGSIFESAWNPSIGAHPFGGFLQASCEYAAPAYAGGSAITVSASFGGGAPFVAPGPPVAVGIPGVTWVDYPRLVVDDYATNPAGEFGSVHVIWIEYIEGGDADANGNGNTFDDPADMFNVMYSFSNTLAGPFPYPAFSPPVMFNAAPLPVADGHHESHRASASVVHGPGTPFYAPGACWVTWRTAVDLERRGGNSGTRINMASVKKGVVKSTAAHTIPHARITASSLLVELSGNSAIVYNPSACGPPDPGALHWTAAIDIEGDVDIYMVTTFDGGATFTPLIKVNQDDEPYSVDQWAPELFTNSITGEVGIVYYDRRRYDPDSFLPLRTAYETRVSITDDCGLSWTEGVISDGGPVMPITSQVEGIDTEIIGSYLGADWNALNGHIFTWNDARGGASQDIFSETSYCLDEDYDGYGVAPCGEDCNDDERTISPKGREVCDAFDNDCDGVPNDLSVGDIDGDGGVDISDLTILVDHLFINEPPLPFPMAANVDGELPCLVDISDLTKLIDHLFINNNPLPQCAICP